jgi:hypothetical protein
LLLSLAGLARPVKAFLWVLKKENLDRMKLKAENGASRLSKIFFGVCRKLLQPISNF